MADSGVSATHGVRAVGTGRCGHRADAEFFEHSTRESSGATATGPASPLSSRHWVLFTRRSFERLADRCGLRVRSAKSVQGAAFWAVSVIIALHRRGLVRLAARKPAVEHWLFPLLAAVFVGVDLLRMPFASTSQIGFVLGAHDER